MTVTEEESTKDLRQNTALSDEFAAIMTTRHNFKFLPNDALGASTDFVSYVSINFKHSLMLIIREISHMVRGQQKLYLSHG
jgi:hypothetical protein